MQLIFCSTDVTKRVWRNITFPQTVTPRQELCIAQLNNRRAKSHWHSFERASKRSSESGRAESMRANNPLCPLTPHLSRSTSPPGTRGTRVTAGSKVRTTTGLSRVTCQGWNPSARAGQFPPPFFLLLLLCLTCLEWVQMCDAPTLEPSLDPPGSTKPGTHARRAPGPKCQRTLSHHFQAIVWGWWRCSQLSVGHFILQDDPTDGNLTAHITHEYGALRSQTKYTLRGLST